MPHNPKCSYFEGAGECTCKPITSFEGRYRFLSNFYDCSVFYDGLTYPSSEHAFQAAKTMDPVLRLKVRDAIAANAAKRIGRSETMRKAMRPDWDAVKIDIMRQILVAKFQDPILRRSLQQTAPATLIEGNWWGDRFWGQCPLGNGENWLGRLLMELRDA